MTKADCKMRLHTTFVVYERPTLVAFFDKKGGVYGLKRCNLLYRDTKIMVGSLLILAQDV